MSPTFHVQNWTECQRNTASLTRNRKQIRRNKWVEEQEVSQWESGSVHSIIVTSGVWIAQVASRRLPVILPRTTCRSCPPPCQQEPEGASPPGVGDKSRMTGSIKKVRESNSFASVIYGLHSGFLTCERRKQECWQDGCKGQWTYQGRIALHQFALEKPRLCKRRRLRACRWSTPASIARQCKHAYSKIAKIIGAHW